jgi:hypothetical protein
MILTSGTGLQEQEFGRKTPEKSEDFPVWNIASIKSPEFPGTDRFLAVLTDLCRAIVYCSGQNLAGFS